MKKVLLATTTLVGVSLAAGSASAAEKIKLSLGGYMEQYFGGFGEIKDGHNNGFGARDGMGIDTETRVYVEGSTVLDNGLTVGAFISFIAEANSTDSNRNVEEQWAYVSGNFGALYAGERNGVFDEFAVRAPNVSGRTGQDIQEWVKYSNGTEAGETTFVPSLETTLDDHAPRISYVTPSWYGFSAGLSYAPNAAIGTARGARVREGRKGSNEVQFAIAYDGAYGDLGIKADGGVATTLDGSNRLAYRGGLLFEYANFAFGGDVMGTVSRTKDRGWASDTLADPDNYTGNQIYFNQMVWEVGGAYEVGPYGVSLTYSQNNSEVGNAMTWQLGGSYKLGPGITAVGQIFYADNDAHDLPAASSNPGIGRSNYRSGVGALSGLILEF